MAAVVGSSKCQRWRREHIDNKASLHIVLEHWGTQDIADKGFERPTVLQTIVRLL